MVRIFTLECAGYGETRLHASSLAGLDSFMLWLGFLFFLLALAFLLWMVPARCYRLAWINSRAPDGSRHPRRSRHEAKRLLDFLAELVLAPLFAFALSAGVLLFVHEFIMPIPMIADIASMYSADMAVWDARMETGKLGDVGVTYLEWRLQQGFSRASSDFWRSFLRQNWFFLAVCTLVFAAFQYWFWTRYFAATVGAYYRGLTKRRKVYMKRDMERAARAGQPQRRRTKQRGQASVPLVSGGRRARPAHQQSEQ